MVVAWAQAPGDLGFSSSPSALLSLGRSALGCVAADFCDFINTRWKALANIYKISSNRQVSTLLWRVSALYSQCSASRQFSDRLNHNNVYTDQDVLFVEIRFLAERVY